LDSGLNIRSLQDDTWQKEVGRKDEKAFVRVWLDVVLRKSIRLFCCPKRASDIGSVPSPTFHPSTSQSLFISHHQPRSYVVHNYPRSSSRNSLYLNSTVHNPLCALRSTLADLSSPQHSSSSCAGACTAFSATRITPTTLRIASLVPLSI